MCGMRKPFCAAAIAAVVFGAVAGREWTYRSRHPYALGPSGELIALAAGGLLLAVAVGWVIYELARIEERTAHEILKSR